MNEEQKDAVLIGGCLLAGYAAAMLDKLVDVFDSGHDGFTFGVLNRKNGEEAHYTVDIKKEIIQEGK